MWEKISRYYPPWLDIFPLLLLGIVLVYISGKYETLPDLIPTHFGPSGTPDAWSEKSIWSVYGTLIIGSIIYISMTLINIFLIILPDDPRKVINISERQKDLLGPEQLEKIRAFAVRSMVAINYIVVVMIAYLSFSAIKIALGLSTGLGYLIWIFFIAIMFISIYMVIKLISMTSTSHIKKGKNDNSH